LPNSFAQQRVLISDDFFRLESVGTSAFSPDGEYVAFVRRRPKASGDRFAHDPLGFGRTDIWLAPVGGDRARNLTKAATENSGYWSPSWSPDGRRLAMLSAKDGHIRLMVWERDSEKLRAVSDLGVDLFPRFIWLSNEELLCPVLPEGMKALWMTAEMLSAETAMKEWPKASKGREVAVSVLDSRGSRTIDGRPEVKLVRFHQNGGNKTIVSAVDFGPIQLSSDKRFMVVFRQAAVRWPKTDELLPHLNDRVYQADLFDLQGQLISSGLGGIEDIRPDSVRWAPNGKELAFIGKRTSAGAPTVFKYSIVSKSVHPVNSRDLNLIPAWDSTTELLWSGTNELVVRAKFKTRLGQSESTERWDWWAIEKDELARNLTASMKSSPSQLIAESGGRTFVGLSEGRLW
ncbi:MAG: TolB family protein, partial [Pyrinomonadaceae bacterium]